MNLSDRSRNLLVFKIVAAVVVGFGVSVAGVFYVFLPPLGGVLIVWLFFLCGGLYLGITLPRVWWLAVGIAWAPLISIGFRIGSAFVADSDQSWHQEHSNWIEINITFISPLITLLSGYLGSVIQKRFHPPVIVPVVLAIPGLLTSFILMAGVISEFVSDGHIGIDDTPNMMAEPPPLHKAAEQGNLAEITRLFEQGEDINRRDNYGRTAVHYAVGEQHAAAVELLLSYGANPDIKDKQYRVTPLHWATGSGNTEIVLLLAPKMRNIDAQNAFGETSADIARMDKKEEILRILIANGAKINVTD